MRIIYQNGKLFLSLTDNEVDNVYKNKHSAVEMDIRYLKVLHEDINKAVAQHWQEIEVPREVMRLQPTIRKSK